MSVQALNRKEAIVSGEDIAPVTREEYYLKGLAEGQGGGGLDYVIPEQTVTFTNEQAVLQNINASGLVDGSIVIKTVLQDIHGNPTAYEVGEYVSEENSIYFGEADSINVNTGVWNSPEMPDNSTYTISAIRGF